MNKGIKIYFLLYFIIINLSIINAQTKNICNDSLNYQIFITRWNHSIKNIKTGKWKLVSTTNLDFNEDSILVTQALDGPSLYLIATIMKKGCIRRVSIKSKRDMNISYASIVAWLKVINVFNPELLPEDRKKLLDDLKMFGKGIVSDMSTERGNNTYYFEENLDGNIFTVLTKN
jgi:hypothetical protein